MEEPFQRGHSGEAKTGCVCSVVPYGKDDGPATAWPRAQSALSNLSVKVFATSWRRGMIFCATNSADLAQGIDAFQNT